MFTNQPKDGFDESGGLTDFAWNDAPDLYLNTSVHHDQWNRAVEIITKRNPEYTHERVSSIENITT